MDGSSLTWRATGRGCTAFGDAADGRRGARPARDLNTVRKGNRRAQSRGCLALFTAAFLLTACGEARDPGAPDASAQELSATAAAGFVGAGVCAGCHEAETAAWQGSHHDLAMQPANAGTVLGDFSDVTFGHGGVESRFFVRDGRYFVRTDAADGGLAEFEIGWTFGVEPLQQYLVKFPDGRLQALGLAWDSRPPSAGGQRWFHVYGDEVIPAGDELHWTKPAQNWNYMCADCHSTGYSKNYDAETDSFASSWTDIDVACEACHGPGSAHVERAQEERLEEGSGLMVSFVDADRRRVLADGATTISITGSGSATDQVEACGRCHARRAPLSDEYHHGQPLMDSYLPALLTEPLYFPDGQIRDEVYVYGSFRQSRMYEAGVVCTDCHEPHSLELRADGDAVCAQCHLPDQYEGTAHSRHADSPEAPGCRDCHMPARNYMVVDPRRDHSFRVPRPDLAASLGVTDACAGCHADRPDGWSAAAVRDWLGRDATGLQQFATAFAAADAGEIDAAADLQHIATDGDQPAIVRATALSLLSRYPGASPVETAAVALGDTDPAVRLAAVQAMEALTIEQRLDHLRPLLADPVRAVRIEAARLLAGIDAVFLTARERQRLSETVAEYVEAQRASLDRPSAWLNLGNLHLQRGDAQAAEEHYRGALELDPGFEPAYGNLADLLARLGQEAGAGAMLREGLARHPDSAMLHHALGLHRIRSGERAAAMESFRRAVELAPDDSRFRYVYAVALDGAGDQEQALSELTEAYRRYPADANVLQALVGFNLRAGNVDAARAYAGTLLRLTPDDQELRRLLNGLESR